MREGPFPVLGSTSVIGHHSEFKVEPPGVITGRSGSLGVVQYVHERYWPHNTALWVKDFKGNDPKFVYYCMQGMDFARFNAGAGVPTLNRNHLDSLEVNVPPLPIQRHIAGILSAYDELIENSQRRMKILEAMARALYREWFVYFRFPGHGSVPLVPSPLGEIPEGWEVKKLSEIAENFDRIRKPLSKMQRTDMQGAYPYYGAAKVFDHVNDFIFDGEYLLRRLWKTQASRAKIPVYA
ncbi:MAG: restriction endonuclease subunit S [Cyanobium sp.]